MPNFDDDGWLTAGPTDPDEVRAFYDEWAERYDADLSAWDYRAPARIAGLLGTHADRAAPVLDAGCGTGLSGRAIRAAGFTGDLTGIDLSDASLEIAAETGVYTEVQATSLNEALPFGDDAFGALACIGVLTYVPEIEGCWREFCRIVAPGGYLGFTQREDVWIERDCAAVIDRLATEGLWEPVSISPADTYLPGIGGDMGDIDAHYVLCRVR